MTTNGKELDDLALAFSESAPRPSAAALDSARAVVAALRGRGIQPERLTPDVEGGVMAYVFGADGRYARISCDNDGGVVVVLVRNQQQVPEAWEPNHGQEGLESAAVHISEFLS